MGVKTPAAEESAYPGATLQLDGYRGPGGSKIAISGTGFPANQEVTLAWQSFTGRWAFEEENLVFLGPRYEEGFTEIARPRADASGAFRTEFTIPEDFGGWHNVVARVGGKFAARTAFNITSTFTVSASSGPAGTPLTVRATGLGWVLLESLYLVTWDNAFTGYMMGVTNRGTATAVIRMAGQPGPRILKIWRNVRGIPYLTPHQGPFGALPDSTFVINVTEGVYEAPTVWADPKPEDALRLRPAPAPSSQGGSRLTVSPDKGQVGTRITLRGEGFPASQPVQMTWASRTGRKLTERGLFEGYEESVTDIPSAVAGADGRFNAELVVPNDFAGPHRVTAVNGTKKAESYFSVYPSIVEFTEKVKLGGEIIVRLRGQDWTVQGKTYAVVYDNKFVGYVCGYSANGYVDLRLPAAGPPGVHTIDFYPSIYEGRDATPAIYLLPNLTYRQDGSLGAIAPVFRLTVTVTP